MAARKQGPPAPPRAVQSGKTSSLSWRQSRTHVSVLMAGCSEDITEAGAGRGPTDPWAPELGFHFSLYFAKKQNTHV